MLKIKLARFGKRNQPHYRIVVNEARTKRDGKYIDLIGHYAPTQTPKVLEMNLERYKEWITKGAQPTDTVAHLAARYESGNPFPVKKAKLSKKAIKKAQEEAETKTVAEASKTEETPTEAPATKATAEDSESTAETTETTE